MIITQLTYRFLNILYRQLAPLYDLVAFIVSFGHWRRWVQSVFPFISGDNILEMGFGPGHMLDFLASQGYTVFGIDPSPQMNRLAKKRLISNEIIKKNKGLIRIVRGHSQDLPFPDKTFDTVFATFPTTYIFDPQTLCGINRVLKADGALIVLLSASPEKRSTAGRLLHLLYLLTGQIPGDLTAFEERVKELLENAGFSFSANFIQDSGANLLIIKANPSKNCSV